MLDEAATPSTENTSVDSGLNKSPDKRKRRRLSPHLPLNPETKSINHLVSDAAVMGNNLGVRKSFTPELFEHVNMESGSLGSGVKSIGLTMEDYYEWEDIQNLFRSPPGAAVTTTCVEGHEIEECKVIHPILIDNCVCLFFLCTMKRETFISLRIEALAVFD